MRSRHCDASSRCGESTNSVLISKIVLHDDEVVRAVSLSKVGQCLCRALWRMWWKGLVHGM
jgi:hypothetical protein